MKLVNIGYGNAVVAERVVAVISPDSAPMKRFKDEARKALVEQYRAMIDPYIPAHYAMVDDIIDPRDTRYILHRGLELTVDKTVERPWRKAGVVPV